jgi:hypothetical protein
VGFSIADDTSGVLLETWDGRLWRVEAAPSPAPEHSSLYAVSCASAHACEAIGEFTRGYNPPGFVLAERWDGHAWSLQSAPTPAETSDVRPFSASCARVRDCTVVGSRVSSSGGLFTLAEHWDGRVWRVQPTPSPGSENFAELNGVSCFANEACTAVGDYRTRTETVTLAERHDD